MAMQIARLPKKGINRWKREEIVLNARESALLDRETNKCGQIVIDSGTTLHIHRDRDDFKHVSGAAVRIRGVGGSGTGYKGILKPNKLGSGVPAVWFDDLPVRSLVSTEGLKRDGWETHFKLNGNQLVNGYSGTVLPLSKGPSGLPILNELFDESEEAFVCTPCAEVELDEFPAFNVESSVCPDMRGEP